MKEQRALNVRLCITKPTACHFVATSNSKHFEKKTRILHTLCRVYLQLLQFSSVWCLLVWDMRASHNFSSLSIPLQLHICYFWQRWTPSLHVSPNLFHPQHSRPFRRNSSFPCNWSNHLHVSLTAFASNVCQNVMQNYL